MHLPGTQSATKRISVLIADSNAMVCRLLAEGLQRDNHLQVIACALDNADLSSIMQAHAPNVALIGTSFEHGARRIYEQVARFHQQHPSTRLVCLLDRSDRESVIGAFRAGARGVLCLSNYQLKLLRRCVKCVANGQIWATSKELGYLVDSYCQTAPIPVVDSGGISLLTPREEEVYHLVAGGLMNREIAESLGLSERTVKNYVFHIFDKLGISSRVELVLHASAHKLSKSAGPVPVSGSEESYPDVTILGQPSGEYAKLR